jgi:SAM-dependent methyltransferase
LWDVIEHISHTENLLQKCAQLLRPGGLLFIKTPNADALLLRKSWSSWPLLELYWQLVYPANPKEHIYHFTPDFLITLLNQNNYQIREFDSWQNWDERVVVGRDLITMLVRRVLMFITWKIKLPYEMTILAENKSKKVFRGNPGY